MKILFGTDGSRYALSAARFLSHWLPDSGVKVDLVSVISVPSRTVRPGYGKPRSLEDRSRGEVGRWQDATADSLAGVGHDVNRIVRRGVPSRVLVELAREGEYDLVVVGAKGRSDAPHFEMGSVALAVLEHAPPSVLMVREREAKGRGKRLPSHLQPFRLLLSTDGEVHSFQAARRFFQLFEIEDLEVEIVTAVPEQAEELTRAQRIRHRAAAEDAARKAVNAMENELPGRPSRVRSAVLDGDPAAEVAARASETEADLIVLGSRGIEGTRGTRVGSVALAVARAAPCSVLLVREAAPGAVTPARETEGVRS